MDQDEIHSAQSARRLRGQARPASAIEPGPGQEPVWDHPRAQAGGFQGGWITAEIVGPFEDGPGTGGG